MNVVGLLSHAAHVAFEMFVMGYVAGYIHARVRR